MPSDMFRVDRAKCSGAWASKSGRKAKSGRSGDITDLMSDCRNYGLLWALFVHKQLATDTINDSLPCKLSAVMYPWPSRAFQQPTPQGCGVARVVRIGGRAEARASEESGC